MQLKFVGFLLCLMATPGCAKSPEQQSVLIEFRVQTSDGRSISYDKVISFVDLENSNTNNLGPYECRVELDGTEYRIGFWSHLWPRLSLQAVDIRYNMGSVAGTGLTMQGREFSVYRSDTKSSMMVEVFRTQFLEFLREEYPNQYKNNLDCHILTR